MKASCLPTVNQLMLALDRCDQAITDTGVGRVIITVGQLDSEPLVQACKPSLLAELARQRAALVSALAVCGVELD